MARNGLENLQGLVAPHIDSFNYFADRGLRDAVSLLRPVEVHDKHRKLRFFLWFENPSINKPFSEDGHHRVVYPAECRQSGTTYRGDFRLDLCVSHFDDEDDVEDGEERHGQMQRLPLNLGRVPVMVKSDSCHLRDLNPEELVKKKEEALELGGYFICNGIERLLRLLIAPRRNYVTAIQRGTLSKKGSNFSDKCTSIRCVRKDQSAVTNRLVYVNNGSASLNFSLRKQEYFIPLGVILKALTDASDMELYELMTAVAPPEEAPDAPPDVSAGGMQIVESGAAGGQLALLPGSAGANPGGGGGGGDCRVGTQFVRERALAVLSQLRPLGLFTRTQCLAYLGKHFRSMLDVPERRSDVWAGQLLLQEYVLVHLDQAQDKLQLLMFMLQKLWAFVDGLALPDNPDTLQHHELYLPGHLLTMFLKERLQLFLQKARRQAELELASKPERTDLRTSTWLRKVMGGGFNLIGKDVEYLLNTGNLSSPSGLDLTQRSGFTVVADKLNFHRYLSHFRSVHRGAFFATLRTTTVRKLLPESWGFMCPVHTPDGAPCGLLNHLARACLITTDVAPKRTSAPPNSTSSPLFSPPANATPKSRDAIGRAVLQSLSPFGVRQLALGLPIGPPPDYLTIMLDGLIIGQLPSYTAAAAVSHMRCLKTSGQLPPDLEVAYIPPSSMGTFPGIFLFSTPARFVRPVKQLPSLNPSLTPSREGTPAAKHPPLELIGSLEQVFLDIACPDGGGQGADGQKTKSEGVTENPSHEEIRPNNMLSMLANLTPWSNYNQSPRNMYQCQMAKQTMGMPLHTFQFRADNKLYRLQSPQSPIARTDTYDDFDLDSYPTGTNAIVAVLAYTGYDMEDAMIINKSAMERGFKRGYIYKNETLEANPQMGGAGAVGGGASGGGPTNVFQRCRGGLSRTVDNDGLPRIGEHLKPEEPYACVLNTVTRRSSTMSMKGSEAAIIDGVAVLGTAVQGPLHKASVRMRIPRNPQIGDKFSSRHGQKGVLSQLWPDIDMPFTAEGIRPDIIINPHAFPSRMTIGMLVESMAAKNGALHGYYVNASTFRSADPCPKPLIFPPHRKPGRLPASARKQKHLSSSTKQLLREQGAAGVVRAGAAEKSKSRLGQMEPGQEGENVVDLFGRELTAKGYNYYGTERMYSGIYGTEMECDIYIGIVYYQRLRHMVSDKFQVRSTGPVNPITQQPVKGRKRGGGIRFGEMERDAMLSHGAAYLLHDRLHTCSDYHVSDICSLCGSLLSPSIEAYRVPPGGGAPSDAIVAQGMGLGVVFGYGAVGGDLKPKKAVCRVCETSKGIVRIAVPYVFKYLVAELGAMNIKVTLDVK